MITGSLRKWLAFGTGVGIEIRGDDLLVTAVRVRPRGVRVLASTAIVRFRQRPAAEWGAEYAAFLKGIEATHLTASVLLPRDEVIVRQITMPGVADRDLAAALRFQLDSLHPYAEEDVAHTWARAGRTGTIIVGIARKDLIEEYAERFLEAGIRISSFLFSAAVIYSAARVLAEPPAEGFLTLMDRDGGVEAYGESPAHPVFSAIFELRADRAATLAAAELRLPAESESLPLLDLLPRPESSPDAVDAAPIQLSYATSLCSACPWLAVPVNLLPAARRSTSSRLVYVPTAALALILLALVVALLTYGGIRDREYLDVLQAEIARHTPQAARVREIEAEIEELRARRETLRQLSSRTQRDLDALLEMTRVLKPPAWVSRLQLSRDSVLLGGEAPQAAPLLEAIDHSGLFRNSEFTAPISPAKSGENFAIRSQREDGPPPALPAATDQAPPGEGAAAAAEASAGPGDTARPEETKPAAGQPGGGASNGQQAPRGGAR